MSSYKKYRSKKSIYHPGISLNHPITYNQKKGMILQRDTNLPEPGHVYTRKELEKMYKVLTSFNMIRYPVYSIHLDYVSLPLDAGETTTITLNNAFMLAHSSLASGQPYHITSFSVDHGSTTYSTAPAVSYILHNSSIETFAVEPTRTDTGFARSPISLDFGCPYHISGSYMNFPVQRFNTTGNSSTYVSRGLYEVEGSSELDVVPWNDYLDQSTTELSINVPSLSTGWQLLVLVSYLVNN